MVDVRNPLRMPELRQLDGVLVAAIGVVLSAPMTLTNSRRLVMFVAVVSAFPAALAGCPKKDVPQAVPEAAPPPPASTPEITEQAKAMGSSPEANQVIVAAAMCDTVAAQMGASGSAPEFAQIRAMLKSITLPAACAF